MNKKRGPIRKYQTIKSGKRHFGKNHIVHSFWEGATALKNLEELSDEILQLVTDELVQGQDKLFSTWKESLKVANQKKPSSKLLFQIVASMCGAELALHPDKDDKYPDKAAKFFSYCSSELQLIERDLPEAMLDKIDTAVKAGS